ncbi:hypothetical protein BBJ28_00002725 [Nothophytophthora sp. Chile5]|nr:hypothetical protein BBJ28_00002725 [Nothophytophthora sp. Chile5]
MTGATTVCRPVDDVAPLPPPVAADDGASCAMTVVTVVEKSLLRTLAFVLYQLDRNRAKYCATSILQWYLQLQTQLPVAAVQSLEKVADSVVSLSDARFADFWRSLVEKDLDEVCSSSQQPHHHSRARRHHRVDAMGASATASGEREACDEEQQHVVKRLYQQLFVSIQRFFDPTLKDTGRTQTPCTSPVDLMDLSQRQPQRSNARHHHYHPRDEYYVDSCYDEDTILSDTEEVEDEFEPGWAVEYMEQESHIPSEMSRRMAKMMHSNVSLNLFRATVTLSGGDEDQDMGYYLDAVTPESFPPTPITRDLQARRMNHYTISILDHATLTLRLLTEEQYGS